MMIFAYFRMKFSSLKMKSDRVLAVAIPGRLMLAAFLAAFRMEPSYPAKSESSCPAPSAANVFILAKESISKISRRKNPRYWVILWPWAYQLTHRSTTGEGKLDECRNSNRRIKNWMTSSRRPVKWISVVERRPYYQSSGGNIHNTEFKRRPTAQQL